MRRLLFPLMVVCAVLAPIRAAGQIFPQFGGRPLPEALRLLQAQGLKLVFSSELVRDDMRVASEPASTAPRKILDEILKPHGLEARSGPGGTLLVVRMRPKTATPASPAATTAPAATGQIQGTVVDARTGAPLPGVSVSIQGTTMKVDTDASGAFTLSKVPAEPQPLLTSVVGYGLARPLVNVAANETTTIVIPLADGTSTYTESVTVAADPFRSPGSVVPGEQSLTSADLMNARGVLTDDPFRAVQALPGIATGNDFRSDFTIRGSDSRHLSLTVDGVETRWPLHIVRDHEGDGSIALINGDILDHVTLASGVYPLAHAGHTGGWVDFSLRDGSRAATIFHGAVGTTSASFVAEGPLGPARRGSWLASIRQSYTQWLISRIDDGGTAFGFVDSQARLVYDLTAHHQLQLTTVLGHSQLDNTSKFPDLKSLTKGAARAGLVMGGWRQTIGTSVIVTHRLAWSGTTFRNEGQLTPLLGEGSSGRLSYRGQVVWSPRAHWLVETGVLTERDRDDSTFTRFLISTAGTFTNRQVEQIDGSAWTTAGDVRVTWTGTGTQAFDAGVLVTHAGLTGQTVAAPWVIAAQPITSRLTLRAGAGLRQQRPDLNQVIGSFGRPDVEMERAAVVDAGVEFRPRPDLRIEALLYGRNEHDGLRLEDNEVRLVNGQLVLPSLTPYWLNALTGTSRGFELVLQRRATKGFNGWVSYAYGRTRYTDEPRGETFWGDADQRHTFNAFAEYRRSPNTSFGVKLRIGSNMPLPGYVEDRGGTVFLSEQRNGSRLPTYGRLDLRANHAFNYTKRRLTLFAELVNVTNRTNWTPSGDVFISNGGRILGYVDKLFPFLPSAGILIDF